ncbi:hypothetical protein CXF91_10445, partial [Planococcus sp. Urea-3u-39]|uniref:hypothetical protein n=1 Tax=Planococcus sp. Urea-3u-39 TaxID=2058328 RepID=UPI000CB3B027
PIKEFNQQQIELQKILSSIESKSKTQSFDFSESLLVVNNVLEDTRIDIETNVTSNPTEFEQELLTWTHEQIEIFFELSNSLRNMCNAIDTKIAGAYIWDLLNKIATIIAIVNFLQANEQDIHIHNYHDDVIIESETDGNKTDIYIEKKEDQHKLKFENDNEKYSGGEST